MLDVLKSFDFYIYGFLFLSVAWLWMSPGKALWRFSLGASVVLAMMAHRLDWVGLAALAGWVLSVLAFKRTNSWLKVVSGIVVFALGFALMEFWVPGFHNLRVIEGHRFNPNSVPYTQYMNLDKSWVGVLVLGMLVPVMTSFQAFTTLLKRTWAPALIVMLAVMCAALMVGFVGFDPKFPSLIWIWLPINLALVCVAEEAFFRGFVQKQCQTLFPHGRLGVALAILVASLVFAVAHYRAGPIMIGLAFLAGMGYGWIYWRTQRIEASILAHFSLNLVHFLGFSYPALLSAYH